MQFPGLPWARRTLAWPLGTEDKRSREVPSLTPAAQGRLCADQEEAEGGYGLAGNRLAGAVW